MNLIPFPQAWIDSYEASSSELLGNVGIALWIAVVIMAPLVEELTFRGFMYTRLKQGMPKWIAVVLTSLVFGIVHGTIIWAIYTFVFIFPGVAFFTIGSAGLTAGEDKWKYFLVAGVLAVLVTLSGIIAVVRFVQ